MARRQLNIWIAFADIAFVLFVAALTVASGYRNTAASAIERIRAAEAEAQRAQAGEQVALARARRLNVERMQLQEQLRRTVRCSDVQPLFNGLSTCLARSISTTAAVRSDLCSMTIREDLLRFETNSDRPINKPRAQAVARCVYSALRDFDRDHPAAVDAIASISIDGYTDCQGRILSNLDLGAARASRLFAFVMEALESDRLHTQQTRDRLLSKMAVRSFGQERPVAGSRCAELGQYAPDRRVTIAVEMRPQSGMPEVR